MVLKNSDLEIQIRINFYIAKFKAKKICPHKFFNIEI